MAEQNLTPWFPFDVAPVRPGVYEVLSDAHRAFAYWNGERFGWRCWMFKDVSLHDAVDDAFLLRKRETCLAPRVQWRGLSEKPHG